MIRNYVYLTINKINGKCYIGSHLSRKENDNNYQHLNTNNND